MGIFDTTAGAPAVSWAGSAKGTRIVGVILPTDDGKGYREEQQRDYDTNELLTYDNGDPRMVAVILLQTEFRAWEMTSEQFRTKAEADPDLKDDGLRREYVFGKDAVDKMKRALRAIKAREPVPGMRYSRTYQGKVPVPGGGKKTANLWEVALAVPTPETQMVVSRYQAEQGGGGGTLSAGPADDDPWASKAPVGSGAGRDEPATDEPPF